jgi:hypothetical protein
MNLYFDAKIKSNSEKEPDTSITVFQKKEDKCEIQVTTKDETWQDSNNTTCNVEITEEE